MQEDDDEDDNQGVEIVMDQAQLPQPSNEENGGVVENGDTSKVEEGDGDDPTGPEYSNEQAPENEAVDAQPAIEEEEATPVDEQHLEEDYDYPESSSEEEEEEWRCVCCRKDFKSEGQMENHMKSKKHKTAWKKYQAKLQREKEQDDEILNDMMDELAMEPWTNQDY